MNSQDGRGLANQAILSKIDKLRELNVGSIELPQVRSPFYMTWLSLC
jgi:hypothetical protein